MTPTICSIVAILVAGSGWFVVHKLTVLRERKTRRRAFLAFMARLREEVTKVWVADTFGRSYHDAIPIIKERATLVSGDIKKNDRVRFLDLVNACRMRIGPSNLPS